jgi:hypothetical protein
MASMLVFLVSVAVFPFRRFQEFTKLPQRRQLYSISVIFDVFSEAARNMTVARFYSTAK